MIIAVEKLGRLCVKNCQVDFLVPIDVGRLCLLVSIGSY